MRPQVMVEAELTAEANSDSVGGLASANHQPDIQHSPCRHGLMRNMTALSTIIQEGTGLYSHLTLLAPLLLSDLHAITGRAEVGHVARDAVLCRDVNGRRWRPSHHNRSTKLHPLFGSLGLRRANISTSVAGMHAEVGGAA